MNARLTALLVIGLGAALGANLRYSLGLWVAERLGKGFPYGTMLINILGSFGIGAFLGLAATYSALGGNWRLLIVTGLLGGFTTFSAFSWEAYELLVQGRWRDAALYVFGSVLLGLAATVAGVALARTF